MEQITQDPIFAKVIDDNCRFCQGEVRKREIQA